MEGQPSNPNQSQAPPAQQPASPRDENALYQGNRVVARVSEVEVDMEAKEVRLGEIYNSEKLMIPEECEFRQYRLLIQRVAFATKVDKAEMHKGRILKGVTADILGYREQ